MTRQQLQATIKTFKAQGLISKKFDARQSNEKLQAKIDEVRSEVKEETLEVKEETLEVKEETLELPQGCKKTIQRVLKATGNFDKNELKAAVNLTIRAINKKADNRNDTDKVIVEAFNRFVDRYVKGELLAS